MTTANLIQYYQNLLIMQYALLPNALGTVQAFIKQALADQIVAAVRDGFNLPATPGALADSAVGAQIDLLATYRGLMREVFGLDISRSYMQWPRYGDSGADTDPGLARYGQAVTWFFLSYKDTTQPIYRMNDLELMRLTQFRAQSQSNPLTVQEVDDILFVFFGANAAVFENGVMSLTYLILSADHDSLPQLAAETDSLPRPAGVGRSIIYTTSISGLFGFQRYNQTFNYTFVGFGKYGIPQPGSFLRYS